MTMNESLGIAEVFDSRRCTLGEGPVWHPDSNRVFWVDILGQRVNWKRLSDGETGSFAMPSHIGAFLPREDGKWLAFLVDGIYLFDEESGSLEQISSFPHALEPLDGSPRMRANDAEVSPWGHVLSGTMPYDTEKYPGSAHLYRWDGNALTPLLEGVTISNGIGWSSDSTQMFYVDTPTGRIDVFDCDSSAHLSNRRLFATVEADLGWPDGLALDQDNYLWLALWGGNRVQRFAPDGSLAGYIELPCAHVTSCAFAGEDRTQLIITTSTIDHDR
jgi:sugar lactone lactonase YvrE